MLQTVLRLLPELPLFLMTALATHLIMSFAQTLMHYKLGHRPMGGISSHGRTSVTKATIRPSSSFLCFS